MRGSATTDRPRDGRIKIFASALSMGMASGEGKRDTGPHEKRWYPRVPLSNCIEVCKGDIIHLESLKTQPSQHGLHYAEEVRTGIQRFSDEGKIATRHLHGEKEVGVGCVFTLADCHGVVDFFNLAATGKEFVFLADVASG